MRRKYSRWSWRSARTPSRAIRARSAGWVDEGSLEPRCDRHSVSRACARHARITDEIDEFPRQDGELAHGPSPVEGGGERGGRTEPLALDSRGGFLPDGGGADSERGG